jgi:hypothetical protein
MGPKRPIAVHIPEHGMELASSGLLLAHRRIKQSARCSRGAVRLHLRGVLLPRRRPRTLHLQRRSLPPLPPRGRHVLGRSNKQ